MRKIYLVKKNPEQPADGNNWIVMNSFEFMNFIQTPEGQKRRDRFGQLDACSVDDVIIIAECGTETAKQWRSEKDRHDYLVSIENQSGMTVFSYNTQTTTEDEMSGEELLADNQSDVSRNEVGAHTPHLRISAETQQADVYGCIRNGLLLGQHLPHYTDVQILGFQFRRPSAHRRHCDDRGARLDWYRQRPLESGDCSRLRRHSRRIV